MSEGIHFECEMYSYVVLLVEKVRRISRIHPEIHTEKKVHSMKMLDIFIVH